jgi:Ca-activated chloride channel family protein
MRLFVAAATLALLAAGSQQVPTQTSGVVAGLILDQFAAPVAAAIVQLRVDGRAERTAATNDKGEFRFERVDPGTYEVYAIKRGFSSASSKVTVGDRSPSSIKLTLFPAAAQHERRDQETRIVETLRSRVGDAPPATAMPSREVAGFAGRGGADLRRHSADFNTEAYDRIDENRFHRVSDEPLSTFSIDVDTASYANVRRFLNRGTLPSADVVRVEELINYFRFNYGSPRGDDPFSVTTEVAACPWNPRHKLALIGLQAQAISQENTPPRNLVFLLDVSGSMTPSNKLPLVKTAMRMLVDTLTPSDRVAIVVYAGASGLVLPSTSGGRKAEIQRAIAELQPGGSTNGADGIRLAYEIAQQSFITKGINRVILATDGDFNVGVTSQGELIRLIEEKRERGVFLSVLGVGTGNLKDSTMEKLANRGNGNYAYLDSVHEARRVLIEEAGATLVTVGKDVKIQVEFNPRAVGAYKLIGYENRILQHQDFNDDKKDAGEIGAGHTVTALYEIVPPGEAFDGPKVDPLKYQDRAKPTGGAPSGELMTVKVRYKQPDGSVSKLITRAVPDRSGALTANLGFAAAVAEFGMLLRNSEFKGQSTWSSALDLARRYRGEDPGGYRGEFVRLIELAAALQANELTQEQTRR